MRVEVFASGLAPGHQKDVVSCKRSRVQERQEPIKDHGKWYAEVIDRVAKADMVLLPVHQNLCQGGADKVQSKNGCRADEGEKITVVATTNAVVEPYTVMVLGLNTVVAQAAVMSAWRTPQLACLAVLDRDLHCCCGSFCRVN